ncbi:LuxR C-terminal-related transcriptional regulator [Streptomyces boncukensis]|uniref:LuxR family transcriptional regulator n=1 Tax=Streptomyces boncukensis TaxID=2711219 RepID=A0A6G4WU31_9ACTN|nr:LuxR family transcriptional regulator [Streptomyces boncukensis]
MPFSFSGRRSGQLPAEVTSFVGRTAELDDLRGMLEAARLVTLTGPGGVGKTRLALQAARLCGEQYAHGVRLVELSGLKDPELLPHTVSAALDIPEQTARPQIDVVVEYLAERELLLILDTCEHVPDACALLADLLLPEAPGLTVLATSRQPLDVPGEHVLSVPPLPVSSDARQPGGDALRLFAERAAAVVPGFTLTDTNRQAARALCRRLDGIPLAIELAAVRLRALPLDELAERLGDTFALLAGGRLTTLSRHQTLRTTIGWSHELCTPPERLLWARLSVFSGAFDLAAVEEVCADAELPAGEVVQHLISLVDKSVVLRTERRGATRYRLLDTIREYGAEWLESLGETTAYRDRLVTCCHRRLRHFEERFASDEQLPLYRALAADRDNLRAALEYAAERPAPPGPAPGPLALTASMWSYWACGGLLTEARYWMDKALALAPAHRPDGSAGHASDRAKTLTWYGLFSIMQGAHESALEPLREAHGIARELDDPLLTAWAVGFEGAALTYRGEHERALAMTDEAVAILEQSGDHLTCVMACYAKGFAYALAARPDEAVEASEKGLRLLGSASQERWNQGYLYLVKSFGHILRGEREACAAAARRALLLKSEIGDVMGVAYSLSLLAWVSQQQGRNRRAAWLYGAMMGHWRMCGDSTFGGIAALQLICESVAEAVRQEIGTEAFVRAVGQGELLSMEAAVRLADSDMDSLPTAPRQAVGKGARRRGGTEPGAGDRTGTASLTRREREVAELVAEGLSNREISERLVVSKRTADAHVEHILSKLGFSSRAQIAALLNESETRGAPATPRSPT